MPQFNSFSCLCAISFSSVTIQWTQLNAIDSIGEALSGSGSSKMLTLNEVDQDHTPTKDKHLIKMKREHKAARTLGIIMVSIEYLV